MKEKDSLCRNLITPEQLKNRKRMKELRELEAKRKVDTHRNIIIGELVCKYFPDVMECQPQRSKKDNAEIFKDFENLLRVLAADTELLAHLKDRVESLHTEVS